MIRVAGNLDLLPLFDSDEADGLLYHAAGRNWKPLVAAVTFRT